MPSFADEFDRLLIASPARQEQLARRLACTARDWEEWREQFNRVHGQHPEREAQAAHALRRAFLAAGDRHSAARALFIEARAIHRAGSPRQAARLFEACAKMLERAGDTVAAAKARVLRVDALAVSGRVSEALRLADSVRSRLRGGWAPPWREALRINVANALRLRGDLDRALGAYEAAAKTLDSLGQAHTAAIARMNAGVALLDAGRAEEALARFEAAERGFEAAGESDMALEARYNRACALVRAARLGEGVRALEGLALQHAERGLLRREALCRLDLADALRRAGDEESARAQAERSAQGFEAAEAYAEGSEAFLLAASTTKVPKDAAVLLRRARSSAVRSGRAAIVLRCDLEAEDLRLRSGSAARPNVVRRILRQARTQRQDEIAAEALLLLGEAALQDGKTKSARDHFAEASRSSRGRPWIRAAAQGGLASCLARDGRSGEALRALRRVAEFLDAVRAGLPGPWLRATFVEARLDPWLGRVDLLLRRGKPGDRREAEALLEALAARRYYERAEPQPGGGHLARLRLRLGALYERIARDSGSTHGTSPAEAATDTLKAQALEREVADSWRESERASGATPGIDTASPRPTALATREAALHIWTWGGEAHALLRRGRDVLATAALGPVDRMQSDAQQIGLLVDRIRLSGAADPPVALLASKLQELAARLLEVLRATKADPERDRRLDGTRIEALHLVLDPGIPDLPWESLPHGGRPLASRFSLLRVPCLRVRRASRPLEGPTTFLALGDPTLSGVATEAAWLAGRANVLLTGGRATIAALSEALSRPGIVHVSGHGRAAADAPPLGGIRLADGWFAATDVSGAVEADVVVLAACPRGVEAGTAAPAWGGLPTALLSAGARRVVWTAADVDDRAMANMTMRFHELVLRLGVEEAFGRAIADAGSDPRVAACLIPFRVSGVPG